MSSIPLSSGRAVLSEVVSSEESEPSAEEVSSFWSVEETVPLSGFLSVGFAVSVGFLSAGFSVFIVVPLLLLGRLLGFSVRVHK